MEISHSTSSFDSFALPDFIKVELNESENQLGKINSCENDNYNFESDIQDGFITKDCLTVTESEKKIYSEVIVDDSETFSNDSTWGKCSSLIKPKIFSLS